VRSPLRRAAPEPRNPKAEDPKTSADDTAPAARGTFAASKLRAWIDSGFAAESQTLGIDSSLTIPRTSLREGRYLLPTFVSHDGYLPPDDTVAFATSVSDATRMGLEALVFGLQKVYPGFDNEVHVFHDDSLGAFTIDRLNGLYPRFVYHPTERGEASTLGALALDRPGRVIVLDPEVLVVGDLSPLWTGDERVKAVPDTASLPFSLLSATTGKPPLSSAVISLPRSARGAAAVAAATAAASSAVAAATKAPSRQDLWNVVLADTEVELLATTFNAGHRLVESYYPDTLGSVSAIRFSGFKPWFEYLPTEEKSEGESGSHGTKARTNPLTLALWRREFGQGVRRARLRSFRESQSASLESLRGSATGRPAVMIGNGPSIAQTDLGLFAGFEKFAYNWFVNHPGFDDIRPEHLVLASAKFFGGWQAARPSWPEGYLAALLAREHKPRLWVSHYFRHLVESTPELAGYEVSYFLFEKPFKPMLQKTGQVALDVTGPLTDSLTGVLSAGVPLALHLGATSIALVGCDSNYASETGSYFYDEAQHTSPTNTTANLVSTWGSEASVGQYCYLRFTEELTARGITFVDATVDGALRTVPKLALADVRSLLANAV